MIISVEQYPFRSENRQLRFLLLAIGLCLHSSVAYGLPHCCNWQHMPP